MQSAMSVELDPPELGFRRMMSTAVSWSND